MAFVYEPMRQAGVELIRSLNLRTPPGCGGGMYFDRYRPDPETGWTIDHERDFQFFGMCGVGCDEDHPPMYYCLVWKGIPIRIDTYERGTGNNTVGIREEWRITAILAPKKLICVPEKEICEVIKEAFIAYAHRNNHNVLSVEFPHMPGVTHWAWESIWGVR